MSAEARYRELFRIDLRHGYVGDAPSAALALVPTRACQRQLQRSGCRVQSGPGQYAVWIAERAGESATLELPATPPLCFLIRARDAQFGNYTQRDWRGPELTSGLLYLSSADAQAHDDADRRLRSADGIVLPVRSSRFRHVLSQGASGKPVTLVRQADGATVQNLGQPSGDGRMLDLDLVDVPEGRYALRVAMEDVFDFLLSHDLAADHASGSGNVGLIDISSGAGGLNPEQPAGAGQAPRLTLQFEAHAVIWRYVLVAQNAARPLQNALVECVHGRFTFGPALPFSVRGKAAFAITSAQPIPLSAVPGPAYSFVLKLPSTDGVPQEPITLPHGTPDAIYSEDVAGVRRAVVNIYVYL